uniref:Uncharacterized protein n=1 Tax=Anopheles farauti TaxID=69004 RepID=A0A182R0A8_9DIPT
MFPTTLWGSLFVAAFVLLAAVESREVVCYYGTWAAYRTGNGKLTADNIDPALCTQLNYAFFDIGPDGNVVIMDNYLAESTGLNAIGKMNDLKTKNPALKTLAAVGGWNAGTANFKTVAANSQLRTTFARNAVAFLQKYRFDGMDIDWEYPEQVDKANFVSFLRELANAFAPYKYLLTVAVPGPESSTTTLAYDIPAISSIVSYINLMTYDMQGEFGVTRHHAALYPGSSTVDDTSYKRQLNAEASVKFWLSKGAQASKLTLGVPFYGHSFKLTYPNLDGVGAPVTGLGAPRRYTQQAGMIAYNEICVEGWSKSQYDSVQGAAYVSGNGEWVSYDSVQSINQKCNLISQYGLGGGMVWSIDMDDVTGVCGSKFILLTALNKCVNGAAPAATTTTAKPVTTTAKPAVTTTAKPAVTTTAKPAVTTTAKPVVTTTVKAATAAPGVCTRDGYFRDPSNCGKFYRCASGVKYNFDCPSGLYFNEAISSCDYPSNVKC